MKKKFIYILILGLIGLVFVLLYTFKSTNLEAILPDVFGKNSKIEKIHIIHHEVSGNSEVHRETTITDESLIRDIIRSASQMGIRSTFNDHITAKYVIYVYLDNPSPNTKTFGEVKTILLNDTHIKVDSKIYKIINENVLEQQLKQDKIKWENK